MKQAAILRAGLALWSSSARRWTPGRQEKKMNSIRSHIQCPLRLDDPKPDTVIYGGNGGIYTKKWEPYRHSVVTACGYRSIRTDFDESQAEAAPASGTVNRCIYRTAEVGRHAQSDWEVRTRSPSRCSRVWAATDLETDGPI